jgi:stress response protein YsnF
MPALDPETRERWRDLVVVDRDAATVGTITAFYLDRATGLPTWALVHTGWFTDAQTFLPLTHAVETNDEIRVPYPKAFIQQAPPIQAHQDLSPDDEVVLSSYYGLDDHRGAVADRRLGPEPAVPGATGVSTAPAAPARQPTRAGPAGRPVPRLAVQGPVEVVRSEEELQVGVHRRRRRLRLRLRKYVVTEYLTRTIPVRREEVRLEELPAPADPVGEPDDQGAVQATGDQALLEVVLHREEPVIQLRVVPAERVRLFKDVVTEQRTVTEEVRKEQVELQSEPPGQPEDPDADGDDYLTQGDR